jgi:hypothetical protein
MVQAPADDDGLLEQYSELDRRHVEMIDRLKLNA